MNGLLRVLAWVVALGLVALPVVAVLEGWMARDRWPVTRLVLTAEYRRVSADQVGAAARPHLGQGFFALDLRDVRAALAALPWVQSVEVRKRWPDTLEVSLREHRAVARWGDDRLLSDTGALFEAPGGAHLDGLPWLDGPDHAVARVTRMLAEAGDALRGTGLQPVALRLSPRGAWTLRTLDGMEILLGRQDPLPRLQRFARLLPAVRGGEARTPARVDLRYTNGFAIAWQEPVPVTTPEPA